MTNMQIYKYASMQVCKHAHICKYAHICNYASLLIKAKRYICPQLRHFFFILHILCEKKSHSYIYFLNFGPLPHLKNPYYENVKFFQKIKFSSNQPKNLSILWCPSFCTSSVPHLRYMRYIVSLYLILRYISSSLIGQYRSRD